MEMELSDSTPIVLAQLAPGIDGFLGTRGSLMMDVVVLAMLAVLPILGASLLLVKRGQYGRHKLIQLILAITLLVTVAAFEIDVQAVSGWRERAAPSPYFDPAAPWSCPAGLILLIHLCCAVPTALSWTVVVVRALRNFPRPPQPAAHSRAHALWGWSAAIGMFLTAVTGWAFYWLAFVA